MKESNLIKNLSKTLFVFNALSFIMLFVLVVFYAFVDFAISPAVGVAQSQLNPNGLAMIFVNKLIELFLLFPQGLDYLFFAFLFNISLNLFVLSKKARRLGGYYFATYIVFGLPVFVFVMEIISTIRDGIMDSLGSVLINTPSLFFFELFQQYNIGISAVIFLFSLINNYIDWQEIRQKIFKTPEEREAESNAYNFKLE